MLEGLIPFIKMPEKTLVEDLPVIGQIKLQVFGPLVAVGVILGYRQCLKFAKTKDMDEFVARDLMFWILVAGFVISHWISVIFYFPDQIKENPWVLLTIWNGLSSVGGFFGAFVGMIWFLRKQKQPIMPWADMLIYGLLLGWCFGRLGCSLVHDHPGRIVDPPNALAVGPWPPPNGPYRYDLGLLEWFFAVAVTTYVYVFSQWQTRKHGWLVGLVSFLYGPYRFALDFLRETEKGRGVSTPDLRYAGLTTAQYFSIVIFAVGVWLLFFRKPRESEDDYAKDSDRIAAEQEAAAKEKGAEGSDEDAEGAEA